MRLVFLCDYKTYRRKMSRVRFQSIDAIKRYPGVWLKKTGPGWPDWPGCKKVDSKWNPDLVIWYKPLAMGDWNKIQAPRCLRYNEMWNKQWTKHEIKTSNSRLVICHHLNDMDRFDGNLSTDFKLIHNPHCGEIEMYHDWGEEKTVDVTLFGTYKAKTCYPLRAKVGGRVGNMMKKAGINFQIFHHPGYKIQGLEKIKHHNKKYAKAIARTKIGITCCSDYKYALAKYPEIPLCKTALCADVPKENEKWYRQWMIEISKDYNAEQIIDIIQPYLKDEEKLRDLTMRGYEENVKHRKQEDYARRFVKIAEAFLNGHLKDYEFGRDKMEWLNGGDKEHT